MFVGKHYDTVRCFLFVTQTRYARLLICSAIIYTVFVTSQVRVVHLCIYHKRQYN